MNGKNTFILIVVGFVILAGGWFLFSAEDLNAPATLENGGTAAESEPLLPPPQDGVVGGTSSVGGTAADGSEKIEEITETGGAAEELQAEGSDTAVVTYTASGFSPETVEISAGSSITFTNEGEGPMWVASAVHPTHSLYPEKTDADCLGSAFDQCGTASSGESWSFTFNSVGEWKYHNHMNSAHRGTVVVK